MLAPLLGCQGHPKPRRPPDATAALLAAERHKCRRIRTALLAAGARPRRLEPLQTLTPPALRPDEALLSFHQRRGVLARYLLTARRGRGRARVGTRVEALRPLSLAEVEPLLIALRDALELGEPSQPTRLWQLLARAHARLLDDVLPRLDGVRHLVVLPDGLTRFVPLHALRAADADVATVGAAAPARFVGHRYTISYAPCLALASPASVRPRSVEVVLAGYGSDRAVLAGARAEAQAIAAVLPSRTHARADAAAFERALGRQRAAVHFAGHGLAPLGDANATPELVFAAGGRSATAASCSRLPVRAPLVVLASCAAAYAARFRDDQRLTAPTNLVEALLAAGASTVVASSWTVKDRQSAATMRSFYRHLTRAGPAAAMARAYRESAARLRPPHPRFWGAYAVYGAWR